MSNKYGDKYRVHNLVKFDYSQIGEYIDEYHTDRPLRNDELVDLLNGQDERIKDLLKELKQYKLNCLWCSYCTMDSASIHCLKREDIPYGMIDGKTHEYAMTCEFYDGDME